MFPIFEPTIIYFKMKRIRFSKKGITLNPNNLFDKFLIENRYVEINLNEYYSHNIELYNITSKGIEYLSNIGKTVWTHYLAIVAFIMSLYNFFYK